MAILTYFAAHWVLSIATTLTVVALGAAAYVFKNLKFALAAIVVAIAGFAYQGAVMSGVQLQLQKDLAEQNEILKDRAKTIAFLGEFNTKRALEDASKIEQLEKAANETPANSGACIDRAGASRLRNIR
jgi:hypothetical protein